MKLFTIIVALVLVTGTAFAMSDYIIPKVWKYKITVEIETPEGIKTGSAIREVRARKNLAGALPDAPEYEYDVFGEAVVIDLKEKGVLFALIDWDSYKEFFQTYSIKYNNNSKKFETSDNLSTNASVKKTQIFIFF